MSPLAAQPTRDSLGVAVVRDVWMRRRPWTLSYASLTLAMSAFWAWMWVYFPILGHNMRATTVGTKVFLGVFTIGFAAVLAVVAVRIWRAGLLMGSEGIVLRGVFKTRSLALGAVTAFAPRVGSRYPSPWLNRPHGHPLLVTALSLGGFGSATTQRAQQLQP